MLLRRTRDVEQKKYEAVVKCRPPLPVDKVRTALALHDKRNVGR